jgi:transposase
LEDQPVPDVISTAPADVRLWVALDVHKFSIVAAVLPPAGGRPEVSRIETTEKAIRRFIKSLGGRDGLAVCYEAGPGGFALWRLLSGMGVACDVIAPSLVPVRAGDRVKTDRRDAKKLAVLFRGGLLRFVQPPTPETEGLRDLLRCRDDIRCARTAARHRVAKQLLRHGRIYRDGKKAWTLQHRAWVLRQRLDDPLAHEALSQMLTYLDSLDRQLAALDAQLEHVAGQDRWAWQVEKLRGFRGIATLTALGLIAEIGDFARFSHPRELASWLGITPSEYSSGDQQHRGHITKSGNRHARRLLTEAAWHYRHPPRRPTQGPEPTDRAWQAQIRLFHRHRHLTQQGKRSTVVTVAVARELAGFLWADMTQQPVREETLAA